MDDVDRVRLEERVHVLDGILDALDRMDEINRAIRGSADRSQTRLTLGAPPFSYSENVANHILDLSVSRQTMAGSDELRRERQEALGRLSRSE